MKFNAVRSPVSSDAVGPFSVATRSPGVSSAPSWACALIVTRGSTFANTIAIIGSPLSRPGCRATRCTVPDAGGGIIN